MRLRNPTANPVSAPGLLGRAVAPGECVEVADHVGRRLLARGLVEAPAEPPPEASPEAVEPEKPAPKSRKKE